MEDLSSQNRFLIAKNEAEVTQLRIRTSSLQHHLSTLEAERDTAIKCKDDHIEALSRALKDKDSIISGMQEQVTRMREYLTSKQQVNLDLHCTLDLKCIYAHNVSNTQRLKTSLLRTLLT